MVDPCRQTDPATTKENVERQNVNPHIDAMKGNERKRSAKIP